MIKKRLQQSCFPVNIAKILRTTILKNIRERLLLKSEKAQNETSESRCFLKHVLKYSLKATEWHLYWSVFLMKLHALKPRTGKHENYECFAYINSLNKQDGWRGETRCAYVERNCFILSDYSFTRTALSPIWIIQ